jgi:hypothetical protein
MLGGSYLPEVGFAILSETTFASGEWHLNTKEILEHINSEISRLQQVKALLQGTTNGVSRSAGSLNGAAAPKVTGKRVLSVEARKKIAAAQRKRWAKARKAQV